MKMNTTTQASSTAGHSWARRRLAVKGGAAALAMAASLVACDPGEMRTEGCEETTLRPVTTEADRRGPWQVGVRTVEIEGLTVEVWYPAYQTRSHELEPATYDFREYLSEHDRARVSDEHAPVQTCDCYRDLAPDTQHGPYPMVMFAHANGSVRTQSLPQMVHWASRGFVVIAADHPGLRLRDALATACDGTETPADVEGDLRRIAEAIRDGDEALAFLHGHVDTKRIGIAGHSAGGFALASLGDLAQVLIPMAADGVDAGAVLKSTLILGGLADAVVPYVYQRRGYALSPRPKRIVGLRDAGHLAFSELCTVRNAKGENLLRAGVQAEICGASRLGRSFQCDRGLLPESEAWPVIDAATAAVLEETLHCAPEMAETFDTLSTDYPQAVDVREQL